MWTSVSWTRSEIQTTPDNQQKHIPTKPLRNLFSYVTLFRISLFFSKFFFWTTGHPKPTSEASVAWVSWAWYAQSCGIYDFFFVENQRFLTSTKNCHQSGKIPQWLDIKCPKISTFKKKNTQNASLKIPKTPWIGWIMDRWSSSNISSNLPVKAPTYRSGGCWWYGLTAIFGNIWEASISGAWHIFIYIE